MAKNYSDVLVQLVKGLSTLNRFSKLFIGSDSLEYAFKTWDAFAF